MFNLNKFISDSITMRQESLFAADIENNRKVLAKEIEGKSVCVIGGAGTIGSSFIRAVLPFKPSKLIVNCLEKVVLIDTCENETSFVKCLWTLC